MMLQLKTIAFSDVSRNKLRLRKTYIHFHQLLNDTMKLMLQYLKILDIILYLSCKKLQIIFNIIQ